MMHTFWHDLRYALRLLRKNPGFAALAVLTLGLGIGACTSIFSVAYGVLWKPLPYAQAERLVAVNELNAKGGAMDFADPNFEDVRDQNHTLEGVAEYGSREVSVSGGSTATRASGAVVSRDFFRIMRISPVLGREFAPEEQREGGAPALVVSYGFWQRCLGTDTNLARHPLTVGGRVYNVVGVLPRGFSFPPGTDFWAPREQSERLPSRTAHNWSVVSRLKDGVTLAQAHADLSAIARRLHDQYGEYTNMVDVALVPLLDFSVGLARPALLMLLGAVGFLLLLACANVANLLLAQLTSREREMAIRLALGAGRGRLARQGITETLLLSFAGGCAGVLLAIWGVDFLRSVAPANLPRVQEIAVSWPVLAFTLLLALTVAAALGPVTATRTARRRIEEALREGSLTQSGTRERQSVRKILMGAQVAISLVLLVGAGLLGRSFVRLLSVQPGFRTDGLVTMDLALPDAETPQAVAQRGAFLNELTTRLQRIPGVAHVGGVSALPLDPEAGNGTFLIMSGNQSITNFLDFEKLMNNGAVRTGYAEYRVASADYFRTLQIPLRRGRLFQESDGPEATHVAAINEALARSVWPGQDPIGQRIEFGNMDGDLRLMTIVGVVGDVHDRSLERPPRPTVFGDVVQRPGKAGTFSIVMETGTAAAPVISAARGTLAQLDPNVPPKFRTIREVVADSVATRRFNLTLLGVFALAALLLAAMGTYGVIAYGVARRTREIGIRFALGAQPDNVLRMILSQGLGIALLGVAVGVVGALALTRVLQGLLFGVSTYDPVTFAGVSALLIVVAAAACYVPARRAMRVDPIVALRYE